MVVWNNNDLLNISLLQQYLFVGRRFIKLIEGINNLHDYISTSHF